MPFAVAELAGHRDTYITYNRFWGRRRLVTRLRALDALFVDVDTYKLAPAHPVRSMSPDKAAKTTSRTWPTPSCRLHGGDRCNPVCPEAPLRHAAETSRAHLLGRDTALESGPISTIR
jgi:hypothetical protein